MVLRIFSRYWSLVDGKAVRKTVDLPVPESIADDIEKMKVLGNAMGVELIREEIKEIQESEERNGNQND